MITVKLNTVDISDQIDWRALQVVQTIDNTPGTATFIMTAPESLPEFDDDIEIYDGLTKIFGGKVVEVSTSIDGLVQRAEVKCVCHRMELDRNLVAKTYEDTTVADIISDLFDEYATSFTHNHISGADYEVERIVFNQVPLSLCLKRLADITSSYWYIDPNKDLHFFPKFTEEAPFDLTDTSGKYIFQSLARTVDGSQMVNRVKVRGGDYNGSSYEDIITVSGNDTKSFNLPYKFADLRVWLDSGGGYVEQTIGIDFIDDFADSKDVLYNFNDKSFRFETALSDGDKVKYSGNPKVPVLSVASAPASIAKYGIIEKLVRDNSIESNIVARKRAAAELLSFADEVVDASFTTYEAGLAAGMLIKVSSDLRDFDDDLIIKRITFSSRSPLSFQYIVQCISTQQFTLIDLLKKIIEPEPRAADADEVSEEIFSVSETLTLDDSWTNVAPEDITETLVMADTWDDDAVDPDDLTWVFGYYAPSSMADVKRMARFNRGSYFH